MPLYTPKKLFWWVYWNQPVRGLCGRAVSLSAKSCTFNSSYSFSLNHLILAINVNQEEQMCKKHLFFLCQLGNCGVMTLELCKNAIMCRLSKVKLLEELVLQFQPASHDAWHK